MKRRIFGLALLAVDFWLARWVSGLAHLPGICLPEALPCSNSHLGLGLLLRPGPGEVLPAGMCLALGFSARLDLGPSSPWPSFPVLRVLGPGPRKQEEGGWQGIRLTFHPRSIIIASTTVGSGSSSPCSRARRLAEIYRFTQLFAEIFCIS